MPQPIHSEASIQQQIVKWYKNTYCLKHHNPRCMIFSIPNEGAFQLSLKDLPANIVKYIQNAIKRIIMRLIGIGLYPGCADLQIIHRVSRFVTGPCRPMTIFIEVKRPDGIQSLKQTNFELHCVEMGIRYHLVRSLEQFQEIVNQL